MVKDEKENLKKENIDRIAYLKKKIMILEWDKEKNQLNPGKATYLEKIKNEVIELENNLKQINSNNKDKIKNENNKSIENNENNKIDINTKDDIKKEDEKHE
jgi:hypothetical protein